NVIALSCACSVFTFISILISYFFFFSSRRRHTRSKRDWSSDVCSSDLTRSCLPHCGRVSDSRPLPPQVHTSIRSCRTAHLPLPSHTGHPDGPALTSHRQHPIF